MKVIEVEDSSAVEIDYSLAKSEPVEENLLSKRKKPKSKLK